MQGEKLLRTAIYIARLRESSPRAHAYRIRTAHRLCQLIESFIAEEVHRATSINKNDPASMSWSDVGQCLEITKSKAFRMYGGQSETADARRKT